MNDPKHGFVTYEKVDSEYFSKRGLKRYAGVWSLWALGVGAVISGDFSGWNLGIQYSGFGGYLVAMFIVTLMYLGLCYSIAEMSPALPHTGGAYSFGRTAMGVWGGFLTGLAENMEYVVTTAVVVYFMGGFLTGIFGTPDGYRPLWWAAMYIIFIGINIWGVEATFRFTIVITLLALAILIIFYGGVIFTGQFDLELAFNIKPENPDNSRWLPFGLKGVALALPYAMWLYLAIEQLPLAAEEATNVKKDMPRGIILGLLTLIVTGLGVVFLNVCIGEGAKFFGNEMAENTLLEGYKVVFGEGPATKFLGLLAVAGLIASFHTIIFAYGRNIYSLSRAGYFPKWLSITGEKRKTPHVALVSGGVVGFLILLIMFFTGGEDAAFGKTILSMAVFGALIAYAMQCLAFIMLRVKFPNMERPYRSPLGIPGAVIALIISLATLYFLFLNEDNFYGVVGMAIWFFVGVIYFAVHGRHRLVFSPEEQFALNQITESPSEFKAEEPK
jgi:ethanolamine permease